MEVIDERWEYWTPSEEWAEAFGDDGCRSASDLPHSNCDRTGKRVLSGFRLTKRPDRLPELKLSPARPDRPDRLPAMRCRCCSAVFTPRHRQAKFCSLTCFYDSARLPPRPCRMCRCVFTPRYGYQVYCSPGCSQASIRIDSARAVELYRQYGNVHRVAKMMGVNRKSVRIAAKRAGVWRPGKSGPPRVMSDVECNACGRMFRPRTCNMNRFCSRECSTAGNMRRLKPKPCVACGVVFTPARSKIKYCGYKCSSPASVGRKLDTTQVTKLLADGLTPKQIGQRLGFSPITVRSWIRKLNQQEQPREGTGQAGRSSGADPTA